MFHSPLLRHTPKNVLLFFLIALGSVHSPSCLVRLISFAGASVLGNLTNLEGTVSEQKRYLKTNLLIVKQVPWSNNAK